MPGKCAFVNSEGSCYAPPTSWPKQFKKLLDEEKVRNEHFARGGGEARRALRHLPALPFRAVNDELSAP